MTGRRRAWPPAAAGLDRRVVGGAPLPPVRRQVRRQVRVAKSCMSGGRQMTVAPRYAAPSTGLCRDKYVFKWTPVSGGGGHVVAAEPSAREWMAGEPRRRPGPSSKATATRRASRRRAPRAARSAASAGVAGTWASPPTAGRASAASGAVAPTRVSRRRQPRLALEIATAAPRVHAPQQTLLQQPLGAVIDGGWRLE